MVVVFGKSTLQIQADIVPLKQNFSNWNTENYITVYKHSKYKQGEHGFQFASGNKCDADDCNLKGALSKYDHHFAIKKD